MNWNMRIIMIRRMFFLLLLFVGGKRVVGGEEGDNLFIKLLSGFPHEPWLLFVLKSPLNKPLSAFTTRAPQWIM